MNENLFVCFFPGDPPEEWTESEPIPMQDWPLYRSVVCRVIRTADGVQWQGFLCQGSTKESCLANAIEVRDVLRQGK